MRLIRALAGLALAVALSAALAGCGDDGGDDGATPVTSTTSGSDPTGATEPDAQVDVCGQVSDAEVALIVGEAVSGTTIGTGCTFNPVAGSRAPIVQIATMPYDEGDGGLDSAKAGIAAVIDGTPEDVGDLGDAAFVVVGTSMGGDQLQGSGGVLLGGTLAQVTVIQGNAMTADDVRRLTLDLMALAASKA
jgi:hypothetical protein